jgi:hypothetical protein
MTRSRKYSVAEIDEMRMYLEWMSHMGDFAERTVEDRLRTYMLNGTRPAELKEAHEKSFARWQENQLVAERQRVALRSAMELGQ